MRKIAVTVVEAPACHLCADAKAALTAFGADFPLDVHVVDVRSPEGLQLVRRHRAALQPLVLVEGELLSMGRLPRGKLRQRLEQLQAH